MALILFGFDVIFVRLICVVDTIGDVVVKAALEFFDSIVRLVSIVVSINGFVVFL